MKPYHFIMLGLTFEIAGAFFVAVEAIRLDNLRNLRDKLFKKIHRLTLSPRIVIVEEDGHPIAQTSPTVPTDDPPAIFGRFPGVYMGLHYVAGLVFIFTLNYLFSGRLEQLLLQVVLWVLRQPWYISIPVGLGGLWFVVAGLWLTGELIHMLLRKTAQIPINLLDFIDARTPNGTIGMIGFTLLFCGFVLQMLGTYLGRVE